jgi:thymidylate synthase (FAD)
MNLIEPSVEIITPIDGDSIIKHIERCGKVCYKSEDTIKDGSCNTFVKKILESEHESVVEHFAVTVRFTCSRACSHQLVRHRMASYSQESQRYVNYSRGKFGSQITFIKPLDFETMTTEQQFKYKIALEDSEKAYLNLISAGLKPQQARGILPNDTKTEVVTTMNLRSWRHFFKLRTDKHAQLEIRTLANKLLTEFKTNIPVIFDDLGE